MADWLDKQEEAYRQRRDQQQLQDQVQIHRADVLKAKGRQYLDDLTAAVQRDVERYQQRFTGDEERRTELHVKPSGGFKLTKPTFPSASVEVSLDRDEIVASYSFRKNSSNSGDQRRETFKLYVESNDELRLTVGGKPLQTLEEASQRIIERVLFPDAQA
jgi:hypothetical protein